MLRPVELTTPFPKGVESQNEHPIWHSKHINDSFHPKDKLISTNYHATFYIAEGTKTTFNSQKNCNQEWHAKILMSDTNIGRNLRNQRVITMIINQLRRLALDRERYTCEEKILCKQNQDRAYAYCTCINGKLPECLTKKITVMNMDGYSIKYK